MFEVPDDIHTKFLAESKLSDANIDSYHIPLILHLFRVAWDRWKLCESPILGLQLSDHRSEVCQLHKIKTKNTPNASCNKPVVKHVWQLLLLLPKTKDKVK